MPLASHQLEAFFAVAETQSFSRAAERLHVTQPALSQRVQHLETEIGHKLFVRGPGGAKLTDAGARLLRYCQTQRALEAELVSDLAADAGPGLGGTIRIAGYSSIVRSCVVPALAPTFRDNPRLSLELFVREMEEVEGLLLRAAVDFAVLDRVIERPDVEREIVGHEELVLVESATHRARDGVYLDHDARDPTTMQFLGRNLAIRTGKSGSARPGKSAPAPESGHLARSFFDDIYGILDGVAHGYGRAVVPRHLLAGLPEMQLVAEQTPVGCPVVVHWFRQPSYTRAHAAVRDALLLGLRRVLDSSA